MSRTHHHGERKKQSLFKDSYHWARNEPKQWRNMYKHRKRRAELKQVLTRYDEDSDNMFPLDKKPWVYYW